MQMKAPTTHSFPQSLINRILFSTTRHTAAVDGTGNGRIQL